MPRSNIKQFVSAKCTGQAQFALRMEASLSAPLQVAKTVAQRLNTDPMLLQFFKSQG